MILTLSHGGRIALFYKTKQGFITVSTNDGAR